MPCLNIPRVAACPGPVNPVPNPLLRCPKCTVAAQDLVNVGGRRQSIAVLAAQPGVSAIALQGAWTDRAVTIIRNMYDDYFAAHGGVAPCQFAFCWAGSGARREACPYSDIDGFIVLADGAGLADKQYFNAASAEVRKRLLGLLAAEGAQKGFTFCTGGLNPLALTDVGTQIVVEGLTGTALELAGVIERYLSSNNEFVRHLISGLSDCSLAFGENALFQAFKTEADLILGRTCKKMSYRPLLSHRRRMALDKIHDVASNPQFAPPTPADTRFDLKKQFYRVPQFVAQALCWWHGIEGITTEQQVTALRLAGKISAANAAKISMAMNAPLVTRVRSHLQAGKEQEWVRTAAYALPNPDNELVLTADQEYRLRQAAMAITDLRATALRFHVIKNKAFGHRRSPFYEN